MANYVKGAKGTKLLIKVGDGASPENFVHYCTINAEREFALEANVNESINIDCDDPDAPGWVDREVESLSGQITGAGVLNTPDWRVFRGWFTSGEPRNVQVVLNVDAVDGGEVASGQFLLTNLSKTGDRGGKIQGSLTLQSTGPLEFETI